MSSDSPSAHAVPTAPHPRPVPPGSSTPPEPVPELAELDTVLEGTADGGRLEHLTFDALREGLTAAGLI